MCGRSPHSKFNVCTNPKISVALQSKEQIDESARRPGTTDADTTSFTTHALTHHPCSYNASVAISLPVPLLATPTFRASEGKN